VSDSVSEEEDTDDDDDDDSDDAATDDDTVRNHVSKDTSSEVDTSPFVHP
jgi:hypothetical protein